MPEIPDMKAEGYPVKRFAPSILLRIAAQATQKISSNINRDYFEEFACT